MRNSEKSLETYLTEQGFNPDGAPYTPILAAWETFPIVKAIRKWERVTGLKYERESPESPTCRTPSGEPNMQNFPIHTDEGKRAKKAFIPKPYD